MSRSRGSLLTVQCPFGCGGVHVTRVQVEMASQERPILLACRGCEREFYYAGAGESRDSWRVVLTETPKRSRLAEVKKKPKKKLETEGDIIFRYTHVWGQRDLSDLPSHTGVGDVLPVDEEADRVTDALVYERTCSWGWEPMKKEDK